MLIIASVLIYSILQKEGVKDHDNTSLKNINKSKRHAFNLIWNKAETQHNIISYHI